MSELNMANRQCCDLDIRVYGTNKPWMDARFCNTTTAGFSGESVYAMKKGAKAIAFHNPIEGTMKVTFQCHPFRFYSMLSDGEVMSKAVIAVKKDIVCTEAGKLIVPADMKIVDGTVFVYKAGDFGGAEIKGTFASGSFTATTPTDIAANATYVFACLETKESGVKRIAFNDKKIPKFYRITQETLDKDEDGNLIPIKITAYKASPKRNLEMTFSSAGEPAELTIEFDCMTDDDGEVLDMIEIVDEP